MSSSHTKLVINILSHFFHIRMQITLYLPVLASLIVYITQKISEIDVSFVGITYVRFNHV